MNTLSYRSILNIVASVSMLALSACVGDGTTPTQSGTQNAVEKIGLNVKPATAPTLTDNAIVIGDGQFAEYFVPSYQRPLQLNSTYGTPKYGAYLATDHSNNLLVVAYIGNVLYGKTGSASAGYTSLTTSGSYSTGPAALAILH